MELSVVKPGGAETGTVSVSDVAFAREYNEDLVHQVVTAYMAGARAGTRAQKNRAAVNGGGKKPWRQKGTGRARAGTIRSPIFTGGGQTFARSTRDYSQKINRKMYRGAMRSIVSELARQERLLVVKEITAKKPGTKEIAARLAKLDVSNGLIILAEEDNNVMLSVRNIPNIDITTVSNVDPVSLVAYEKVLITADAVKSLDEKLS